jgi:Carbohydrate-selective porin, OprB family/S-layer homology domain
MNYTAFKLSLLVPALGALAIVAPSAQAAELSVAELSQPTIGNNNAMGTVTSVSQLSDVRPTDWAFQALQSLVERYGCIAGYPDRTYRGNRAMTRYEFAAGLNACMDRVNELIAAATADMASKEDLAKLQKLQEEFSAELATLRGRVDAVEAKTATLEKQQFSTTTKLKGESIFSISGVLGDDQAATLTRIDGIPGTVTNAPRPGLQDNTTFSHRTRLVFNTSFTGKDTLLTRLQASNVPNFQSATGTPMARLSYDGVTGTTGTGAEVVMNKLYYRFPFNPNVRVTVDAIGGEFYNNAENRSPLASDSAGSISRFGRFNPLYRYGTGGSGATVNIALGKQLGLDVGYLADSASVPTPGNGLFNGSSGALAQINFQPIAPLGLSLTYVRGYDRAAQADVTGGTGSALAIRPFGAVATSSDNYGAQANFKLAKNLTVSGWAGLTKAVNRTNTAQSSTLWNWAASLTAMDVGSKGSMAGIVFGMPPRVTDGNGGAAENVDTSYHLEALYRYKLSDKIAITPGLVVLFNPEHNKANDTIYVGTLRTVFSF